MHPKYFLTTIALALAMGLSSHAKTIKFSGYEWEIRPTEEGGPGPNHWDENNAWVDKEGALHLKITQRDGKWQCAEIYTTQSFGFGVYQFWATGRVDRFDPNIVLGLFNYPEAKLGVDGTHEMDIEFAKWGDPKAQIGNYTVYPVTSKLGQSTKDFPVSLHENGLSTQRFTWTSASVLFQSLHGHRDDNTELFYSWLYQPTEPMKRISQGTMPVHINLWCFDGKAPKDGQPVEVVIKAFKFIAK